MTLARVVPRDRYRWVILGVGTTGAAGFALLRMGLPTLAPEIREHFSLTLPQVSLAFSALGLGIILTLLPWGLLADRIGERRVMALGLAGAAISLVAGAFAPTYPLLLGALFAAGLFGASTTSASSRAVATWFRHSERGFAMSVRQTGMPIGGALAAISLPQIAAVGGLRGALLALGGVCCPTAVASAVWLRGAAAAMGDAPPTDARHALGRDARVWRLGVGTGTLVVAQSSMIAFLVLFLHDTRGVSVPVAGALLALVQVVAAALRLLVGVRSDRHGRRIPPIRAVALCTSVLLVIVAVLAAAPGIVFYPVVLVATVSTMVWNGVAFAAAIELGDSKSAGAATGLLTTMLSLGDALAPLAFGALIVATSWPIAIGALALAPLIAHVVLAPLERDEAQRLSRPPAPEEGPGAVPPRAIGPAVHHRG